MVLDENGLTVPGVGIRITALEKALELNLSQFGFTDKVSSASDIVKAAKAFEKFLLGVEK